MSGLSGSNASIGRRVALDELPNWSAWPARLLGITPWDHQRRSVEKVRAEYDGDKYRRCLGFYMQSGAPLDAEAVKRFEFGLQLGEDICISRGSDLFALSLTQARHEYYSLIRSSLADAIGEADTVLELGCGYGYNLWMLAQHFPGKKYVGGEFSPVAVDLAARLYGDSGNIRVERFNFYEVDDYRRLLCGLGQAILVLTCHAIEQLPSAKTFTDGVIAGGSCVTSVVQLEPAYELHARGLLGLMRKRYAEVNDYNRDLLSTLRDPRVTVKSCREHVFGLNPLNPASVIHWTFRQ